MSVGKRLWNNLYSAELVYRFMKNYPEPRYTDADKAAALHHLNEARKAVIAAVRKKTS